MSDVAGRLAGLGPASRRVVVIPPEDAQTYKVDSPAQAAARLGASHALFGQIDKRGDVIVLHATVSELSTETFFASSMENYAPRILS